MWLCPGCVQAQGSLLFSLSINNQQHRTANGQTKLSNHCFVGLCVCSCWLSNEQIFHLPVMVTERGNFMTQTKELISEIWRLFFGISFSVIVTNSSGPGPSFNTSLQPGLCISPEEFSNFKTFLLSEQRQPSTNRGEINTLKHVYRFSFDFAVCSLSQGWFCHPILSPTAVLIRSIHTRLFVITSWKCRQIN